MIRDGDRVAVAVSGGKDSLTLLRLLDSRRANALERYEIAVVHVTGDSRGPAEAFHAPLRDWLDANGYEYRAVPMHLQPGEPVPLKCQRCTRYRRRTLFETAASLGCNVVAFGHHADDLAQTTLLNLLYQSRVETMAPQREYFNGVLRTVRPLCFVSEKEIARFARLNDFPPPPPDCPQAEQSRRKLIRSLIRQAEAGCPSVRANLLKAGLRYMKENDGKEKGEFAEEES